MSAALETTAAAALLASLTTMAATALLIYMAVDGGTGPALPAALVPPMITAALTLVLWATARRSHRAAAALRQPQPTPESPDPRSAHDE